MPNQSWDEEDLKNAILEYRKAVSMPSAVDKWRIAKSSVFEQTTGTAKPFKHGQNAMSA
jgi:hypothetical protein